MSDNNGWRHRVIERKRMRVGDLLPNKYNPVGHDAGQKSRMQAVLDKFGIVTELIAYYKDDGELTLFDGHLRQGLDPGQEWDVAITDLSQAECDELALYFDPLAGMSTPDGAIMTALMQDLQDVDGVLGEMLEELALDAGIAFADEPLEDPRAQVDKADELQEKWQVERGQVWEIGRHRLMCGDSTCAEDVERLMGGGKAQAVITDPPYAFGLASTSKMAEKAGGWHDMMNNASWFEGLYRQWNKLFYDALYWVCCNWRTLPILMRAAFDSGIGIDSVMIWYKNWIGPGGMKGLRPTYELIALTASGKAAVNRRDVEDFFTAQWSSYKPTGHKAEKPVKLIAHLVEISDGDIFDPFLGSGTTLVACEQTDRIGYGMEIEPKYCAVTLDRLQRMGLEPRLVGG